MIYADLHSTSEGKGHILLVERVPGEAPATEFDVSWTCSPHMISWGEAWTRDEDFNQIDRSPAPAGEKRMHQAKDAIEREFLALACAEDRRGLRAIKLKAERSPIELTEEVFELVAGGVPPPEALQRASAK